MHVIGKDMPMVYPRRMDVDQACWDSSFVFPLAFPQFKLFHGILARKCH